MRTILPALALVLAAILMPSFAAPARADSITVGNEIIPFAVPPGYLRGEGKAYDAILADIRRNTPSMQVHTIYAATDADAAFREKPEAGLTKYIVIMSNIDLHDSGFSKKDFAELQTFAEQTPEMFFGKFGGAIIEDARSYTPPDPANLQSRIVLPAVSGENRLFITYLFPLQKPAAPNEELICLASLIRTRGKLVVVYQYERGLLPETIARVRDYAPKVLAAMDFPGNGPEPAADAQAGTAAPDAGTAVPGATRVTIAGEPLQLATPTGYVLADGERYGPFIESLRGDMEAEDMTVHAMYVPKAIDDAARANTAPTMDKYLLLMTSDDLDEETFSKRDFRAMRNLFRKRPDTLASETAPGTAEEPRRLGPPVMTETAVFYAFQTENGDGDKVLGAMAMVHSGTALVYVCLYAMPDKTDGIEALKAELPGIVADLRLPPPQTRDGKPFIYAGAGLLVLSLLLGIVFILRDRKAR